MLIYLSVTIGFALCIYGILLGASRQTFLHGMILIGIGYGLFVLGFTILWLKIDSIKNSIKKIKEKLNILEGKKNDEGWK